MRTVFIILLFVCNMAYADTRYFAEIKDNIVERVIVADNVEWCVKNLGGEWVETFMDGTKNYAGRGFKYDKDNFIPPKPYPSWIAKKDLTWEAPVPRPITDGLSRSPKWNEKEIKWDIQ